MIRREGCPYCEEAEKSIAAALEKYPELANIKITKLKAEDKEAENYDFYYAPAFFVGAERISEGESSLEAVLEALRAAGI